MTSGNDKNMLNAVRNEIDFTALCIRTEETCLDTPMGEKQ